VPRLVPWATFRKRKGAVKLHTLLDLRGSIPTVCFITPGAVHDVNLLDQLAIEAGALYIFDRAYLDFARLYRLHQAKGFFVTAGQAELPIPVSRLAARRSHDRSRLRPDHPALRLLQQAGLPERLRRIRFFDAKHRRWLVFLTNNVTLPALTIAQLYKCRWQVELFFKWLKQHLRIKAFYGTSENAVKTQLWIAIAVYVLVAIVKKRLHLEASLYTILQILSVSLFEKIPLLQALTLSRGSEIEVDPGKPAESIRVTLGQQ